MPHYSVFTQRDYSDELTATTIHNGAVTAVSIAGFLTEFGQMRDAIDDITTGVMAKEMWVGNNDVISSDRPTNPFAQRELKWRVAYNGATDGLPYELTIGCADPSGVDGSGVARLVAGTDLANVANEDIAAFITRFNSFARVPNDETQGVVFREMRIVGRNI